MKNSAALQSRTRDDPRRTATQVALIEVAERLFADDGVEAVSTRQIGAAIGSLNTNVVAYHFGGKDGLIEAVFRHRLPEIDRRRGELLAEAELAGVNTDITVLLRIFALPLFEQTDAAGRHSYARFLLGLERSRRLAIRAQVSTEFPITNRVTARLVELLPKGTAATGHTRLRLVTSLFATMLHIIDQSPDQPSNVGRALFEEALAMSAAALAAPAPKGTMP
jgi:AcrR family transcriptional regulator